MVVSHESFRTQTLSKYYKEDLINVLREFYTMEQLQEVVEIDSTSKDNLMNILHSGMKKEDLNVILFNSRNITHEALENFRKPNQRRNSVIVFRDVNLEKSGLQEETNLGTNREEGFYIRQERDDCKEIETQTENFDKSFNAEGIISAQGENPDKSFNAEGIISVGEENKDKTFRVGGIISPPQDFDEPIETQTENLDKSFNVDGIISPQEKNPDKSFNAGGIISAVDGNIEKYALQTSIVKIDSVNENLRETFLLSLNRIQNISQTKEKFQERLKGLVRNQVDFYDKKKSTFRQSDQNYQFFKQHIVPMAKFHNIPLEPYLAQDCTQPVYIDRKTRLLRQRMNANL